MLTLYQFPVSHYCEKVRWALAIKGAEHRTVDLLPGLHRRTVRALGLRRLSLPILVHDDRVLQGSRAIIDHLDHAFPAVSLTPRHPAERDAALAWESFADEQVGPHVRRLCYASLLEHPSLLVPLLASGGAWYAAPLLHAALPLLRRVMRTEMDIDDAHAEHSRQQLEDAVQRLADAYAGREYLVAGAFTRADLAAAALMAPLCRPDGYGLRWPSRFPPALEALAEGHAARLDWVTRLYRAHRTGEDGRLVEPQALPVHL